MQNKQVVRGEIENKLSKKFRQVEQNILSLICDWFVSNLLRFAEIDYPQFFHLIFQSV